MDKYANYVWSSYAVAMVIIVATVVVVWRGLKVAQKTLHDLKKDVDS
jgi:heme exporter protein CcmD